MYAVAVATTPSYSAKTFTDETPLYEQAAMIRVLLFLRAWHAELRLWRQGMRHHLKLEGALSTEQLQYMSETVRRHWIDFSQGYVTIR